MIWVYVEILNASRPIQLRTQIDNSDWKFFGGEDQQILWNYHITYLDIEFWIVNNILGYCD